MSRDSDFDRFSFLFDLARDYRADESNNLSPADLEELKSIRQVLDVIDRSWKVPEESQARVRALFLQKLAVRDPHNPWVQDSIVHSLGDIVSADSEDAPPISEEIRERLNSDETPLEILLDPARRTKALGQALRRAAVPQDKIAALVLWLNRALAGLAPRPSGAASGLLFARRQRRRRVGG